MILICENCKTRYLVPDSSIGDEGRIVKCTHCDHEWHQNLEFKDTAEDDVPEIADIEEDDMPEEDDILEDDDRESFQDILNQQDEDGDKDEDGDEEVPAASEDLSEDDIPEAVKPLPDDSAELPAIVDPDQQFPVSKKAVRNGYMAAACVFLLIGGVVFALKNSLVQAWPPMAALYQIAGVDFPVQGQGLFFDRVTAETFINNQGVNMLDVKGRIINLKEHDIDIPMLKMTLRKSDGSIFDSWSLDLSRTSLPSQEEEAFETSYPELPSEIKNVVVSFVLSKTDAVDASDDEARTESATEHH